MLITQFTKQALAFRREERDFRAKGYEYISENGSPLWELHRGGRTHCRIVDAVVGVDGQRVYIKIEPAMD